MKDVKENLFIHAQPAKCLSCHSCELACSVAHSGFDLQTAIAKNVKVKPRNEIVSVANSVLPMQCRQCEDSPCAVACPTGALFHHEEGFVQLVEENCIGCKVCNMVCPFGAITMKTVETEDNLENRVKKTRANKCDLCFEQMEDGEFNCACVAACPTNAIMLVDYETYRKQLVLKRSEELVNAHAKEIRI